MSVVFFAMIAPHRLGSRNLTHALQVSTDEALPVAPGLGKLAVQGDPHP